MIMKKYILFSLFWTTFDCWAKSSTFPPDPKAQLLELLFPNRTNIPQKLNRELDSTCYDCTNKQCICPKCVSCTTMSTCTSLIGHLVEEVYYPNNLEYKETCVVLDELGDRSKSAIFGPGRTFRDTDQCKDMVMQYLCLFYGSNNAMYTNHCKDDLTGVNPSDHVYVPRYPCRSFCVQVATVCAYSPHFVETCSEIPCPPTESECTPDPILVGQTLNANLGCAIPYTNNPYFKASAPRISASSAIFLALATILFVSFVLK